MHAYIPALDKWLNLEEVTQYYIRSGKLNQAKQRLKKEFQGLEEYDIVFYLDAIDYRIVELYKMLPFLEQFGQVKKLDSYYDLRGFKYERK